MTLALLFTKHVVVTDCFAKSVKSGAPCQLSDNSLRDLPIQIVISCVNMPVLNPEQGSGLCDIHFYGFPFCGKIRASTARYSMGKISGSRARPHPLPHFGTLTTKQHFFFYRWRTWIIYLLSTSVAQRERYNFNCVCFSFDQVVALN